MSADCERPAEAVRRGIFGIHPRLWLVLALALAARLIWLWIQPAVIENEGTEYARLAENLFRGMGYRGIFGEPGFPFPPLYPILIGCLSTLTGNTELSGRIISLIAGTLFIVPLFCLARSLFGSRAGYVAAVVAAFHPILIATSVEVLSEPMYCTLLLAGLYWGVRTLELRRAGSGLLAGIFFGLAYLTRPEAIIYPFLCAALLLAEPVLKWQFHGSAVGAGLAVALTTLAVGAPYIVYVSMKTGGPRVEAKSIVNGVINRRMALGMPYMKAALGLAPDLTEEGPFLRTDVAIPPSERVGAHELAQMYAQDILGRFKHLAGLILKDRSFGTPVIAVLVLIGLLPLSGRRLWIGEGFVVLTVAVNIALLLGMRFIWSRYLVPLVPFLILWSANGIGQSVAAATVWLRRSRLRLHGSTVPTLLQALLVMTIVVPAVKPAWQCTAAIQHPYEKEAGEWILAYDSAQPTARRIMGVGGSVPYYARGTMLYPPYTDARSALAYIHKKSPDYIVLRPEEASLVTNVKRWLREGIPDRCAQKIHTISAVPYPWPVTIYKWACPSPEGLRTERR